ncbi:MAG: tetratricopeptide repeat protein, partial [Deltaproteobacteria bacterium]|nr:tetratricopeptide repeat protein [Deltaproteobacteria bacterium]
KAEEAFKAGHPQEAMTILARVLEREPRHPRALKSLGIVLLSQSRFEEAVGAFESVLQIEPDDGEAIKNLAIAFISGGQYEKARPFLEKLLAVNQNDWSVWNLLIRLEKALGNMKAAMGQARRSLLLNPDQPEIKAFLEQCERAEPVEVKKAETRLMVASLLQRDEEANLILNHLKQDFEIKKVSGASVEPYLTAAKKGGTVWLDGVDKPTEALTREPGLLNRRRVILRLSREEILEKRYVALDLTSVTDIVAENLFLRDHFINSVPKLKPGSKIHVIPRAVDLNRYKARSEDKQGCKIAAPGPHGQWSSLTETLEAFRFLKKSRPEAQLHLSGPLPAPVWETVIAHFVVKAQIAESVFLDLRQTELSSWLADKDYYLWCPIVAGSAQPFEAVHMGLKPLLRDAPGMEELFPKEWLWHSPEELAEKFEGGLSRQALGDFIASRHAPEVVAEHYRQLLSR